MSPADLPPLRIGPFSEAVGVAPERLRTWEQRYGLPRPRRTSAGYRLYSAADREAVEEMKAHLAAGRSPAEAASAVLRATTAQPATTARPEMVAQGEAEAPHLKALRTELGSALERFDTAGADRAFDRLLAGHSLTTALRDAVLPYLHELGERWVRLEISIAQEHFVSRYLEGRLLALARTWHVGTRRALLACPPGEQHTLGLLSFGLVLGNLGWGIAYLGADTPLEEVRRSATDLDCDAVVLSSVMATRFRDELPQILALAAERPVYLGGAGVGPAVTREAAASALPNNAIDGALALAATWPGVGAAKLAT